MPFLKQKNASFLFLLEIIYFLPPRVFGIRLGTMLFAFIIVLGQLLFSMGGFFDRLWVMELGRFVFGRSFSSHCVVLATSLTAVLSGCELCSG
jgi:hypothetical protein